jgi:transposase
MLVDERDAPSVRKGRQAWSKEEKCLIVAETLVPGASVSEIARRHNMNANMLFNWRREARQGRLPAVAPKLEEANRSAAIEFIPIGVLGRNEDTGETALRVPVAEPAAKAIAESRRELPPVPKLEERTGVIEIDLPDGARIRTDAFVNERALRRVLMALKSIS